MELGAAYPQTECGGDPDAVRVIGDGLESLGFDHLLAYDHVLGASHLDRNPPLMTGGYDNNDPFHDPFVMFAYLAGRTERLKFVTGVLVMPQRQTALVAKQAADLALFSGDRFRLGIGVGWNHVEYESLGVDFARRGARVDEQIEVLRRLWTEPLVDFDGEFHRIDRATIVPQPRAAVPIWIGGFTDAPLRRAARCGDGFIYAGSVDTVVGQLGRTRELLVDNGRSPDGFGTEYTVLSRHGVADVAAKISQWREVGGTHASIVSMGLGFDSPAAHLDYFGQVRDELARG